MAGTMDENEGSEAYDYVPGAGDDEESWAQGLTPSLFWSHHQVCPHLMLDDAQQ